MSCCFWRRLKTWCVSEGQYVSKYNGMEYLIYYKYSTMMNIVYVTFMYGMGVPSLFLVGLFSLILYLIQEKLALAYFFKTPPAYNDQLGNLALWMITFAPVFFYLFGYWMMSNPEIFYNDVILNPLAWPISELSPHKVLRNVKIDQAFPLLVLAFASISYFVFHRPIRILISYFGKK